MTNYYIKNMAGTLMYKDTEIIYFDIRNKVLE